MEQLKESIGHFMCRRRNAQLTKEQLDSELKQWKDAVSKSEIVYFKK